MTEADVCSYSADGRHSFFGRPWRKPVSWHQYARVNDPPNLPVPLRYWEFDACRFCGYEKVTPHGFTPRRVSTVRAEPPAGR